MEQFPQFIEFRGGKRDNLPEETDPSQVSQTPEDSLASIYERIRRELADNLLRHLKTYMPTPRLGR